MDEPLQEEENRSLSTISENPQHASARTEDAAKDNDSLQDNVVPVKKKKKKKMLSRISSCFPFKIKGKSLSVGSSSTSGSSLSRGDSKTSGSVATSVRSVEEDMEESEVEAFLAMNDDKAAERTVSQTRIVTLQHEDEDKQEEPQEQTKEEQPQEQTVDLKVQTTQAQPSSHTLKIISLLYNDALRHMSNQRYESALRCLDSASSILTPVSPDSPLYRWSVQTKYQMVKSCFALHRSQRTKKDAGEEMMKLSQRQLLKQQLSTVKKQKEDGHDDEESTNSQGPSDDDTQVTNVIVNSQFTMTYFKRAKSHLEEIAFALMTVKLSPPLSTTPHATELRVLYDVLQTLHSWGLVRDSYEDERLREEAIKLYRTALHVSCCSLPYLEQDQQEENEEEATQNTEAEKKQSQESTENEDDGQSIQTQETKSIKSIVLPTTTTKQEQQKTHQLYNLAMLVSQVHYDLALSLVRHSTLTSSTSSSTTPTKENKDDTTKQKEEAMHHVQKSLSLQIQYGTAPLSSPATIHSTTTNALTANSYLQEYDMLHKTLDLGHCIAMEQNDIDTGIQFYEEYCRVLLLLDVHRKHCCAKKETVGQHDENNDNAEKEEANEQEEVIDKKDDNEEVAQALYKLGHLYATKSDYTTALTKLEQAMSLLGDDDVVSFLSQQRTCCTQSPSFLTTKNKLRIQLLKSASDYYLQLSDTKSSLSMKSNLLVLQKQLFGNHHVCVASTYRCMSAVHMMVKKYEKARYCREEEVKIWRFIVKELLLQKEQDTIATTTTKEEEEEEEEEGGVEDKGFIIKHPKGMTNHLGIGNVADARKALSCVLHDLGSLFENSLYEYEKAVTCYEEALVVEVSMLEELKKKKTNQETNKDASSEEQEFKTLSMKMRETKRKIGGVHYKKGDFSMALMTSFHDSVGSSSSSQPKSVLK